ncbi:MAG: hypothetical protein BWY85_01170 [Firmicutes bacterium ADurb.Bin506]|jgi:hypothetical protein|nr:MAG: hypothetical protein BWY85_01170 [Firmicutes bacterium ADurb.Bin506]
MWQVAHYGDTGRADKDWRPQEMDACAHLGIDLEHPEPVTQVTHGTPLTSVTPAAYESPKALEPGAPVEPVAATFQEARHYDAQVASKPEEHEEPEIPRPDSANRQDRTEPNNESEKRSKPRVIVWGSFPGSKK